MKILLIKTITILTLISACNEQKPSNVVDKEYVQLVIKEDNITPTIDIKSFTLITNNAEADSVDAKEIMQLKRKAPLAMQTKDSALFNDIIANKFVGRSEDEFYNNKNEFIKNRVSGTWTIDTVKYENVVLQFFGEVAVLTYRNILQGTDDFGKPDIEHYCWADFYFKENGKWKGGGGHRIDKRIEYIIK